MQPWRAQLNRTVTYKLPMIPKEFVMIRILSIVGVPLLPAASSISSEYDAQAVLKKVVCNH